MTQEELSERLWDFAARVGMIVDAIPETRLGRHVAAQLVRCGTSAPPNYDESGAAESDDDFIHKLSVALKELRETRGWLRFVVKGRAAFKIENDTRDRRVGAALPDSGKVGDHG